jgi:hypothetical protein
MGIDRDTVRRPLQSDQIEALMPEGQGHQLVLYGDSCSGVPGAPHEACHARVNAVVARLAPPPELIVYTGDEIIGLTADEDALRAQWRHWLDREMAWLDRGAIPLYHATGNHTTYDAMSERVFAEMLPWLPRNGPPDQQGLFPISSGGAICSWSSSTPRGPGSAARGTSRLFGSNRPCA